MKVPSLFRRERTVIQRANAQDQMEKVLAESLRVLSQVCTRVADMIETQRLERAGYAQNTVLRRMDQPPAPGDTSAPPRPPPTPPKE